MARKMNFPGVVADGEAKARKRMYGPDAKTPPHGFRAETVNATVYCDGEDYVYPDTPEGNMYFF